MTAPDTPARREEFPSRRSGVAQPLSRPPQPGDLDGRSPSASERWRRIGDLFHAALALPDGERDAFLTRSCADDPELLAEVSSLVRAEAGGSDHYDRWVAQAAASWAGEPDATAPPRAAPDDSDSHGALTGRRIGRYEIGPLIGAGGMGEVYRAHDTHLGRPVAFKVLPAGVALDPDRLKRFAQEARAASALTHPNVAAVYELGDADGVPYIAMEYVAGRTLDAVLRDGPLPLHQALETLVGIAAALAEAHRAGVVHRDIKPANVMLTDRGGVKVLDFGLAKRAGGIDDGRSALVTNPGLVMGTAHYMSPEQALGAPVDHRSDLFSLGVVAYELITGRRPFGGTGITTAVHAVLHRDPEPVTRLRRDLPRAFDRVLARALARDPGRRYQHAREFAGDLEALGQRRLPPGAPFDWRAALPGRAVTTAVLALAAAAVVAGVALRPRSSGPAVTLVPFTTFAGTESTPAVSRDGETIVYAWDGQARDNVDIYAHRVREGEPRRLTSHPAADQFPAIAPDGGLVAFARQRTRAFVVPLAGGTEREIGTLADPRLTFTPDGLAVAAGGSATPGPAGAGIIALPLDGGPPRPITRPPPGSSDIAPAFSPDGDRIAFQRIPTISVADIWVADADGTNERRITFDERQLEGPVWTRDGQSLVFASGRLGAGRLWRVPAAGGTPEPIPETGPGSTSPAIAHAADRLVFTQTLEDTNVWELPLDASGRPAGPARPSAVASTWLDGGPDVSPDGRLLVFASNRSGRDEIWVGGIDGATARQVTDFASAAASSIGSPRWSPDGTRIAFDARVSGNADVYVIAAGGGTPRRLTTDASTDVIPVWSRDGRWIYFTSRRSGRPEIWRVGPDGGDEVRITRDGGFGAQESTDGQYLIYGKDRVRSTLWRRRLPDGAEAPLLVDADGHVRRILQFSFWRPAPDGVIFLEELTDAGGRRQHALQRHDVATRRVTTLGVLGAPPAMASGGIALSPDGRRLLFTQLDRQNSDIMLLQHFR